MGDELDREASEEATRDTHCDNPDCYCCTEAWRNQTHDCVPSYWPSHTHQWWICPECGMTYRVMDWTELPTHMQSRYSRDMLAWTCVPSPRATAHSILPAMNVRPDRSPT